MLMSKSKDARKKAEEAERWSDYDKWQCSSDILRYIDCETLSACSRVIRHKVLEEQRRTRTRKSYGVQSQGPNFGFPNSI